MKPAVHSYLKTFFVSGLAALLLSSCGGGGSGSGTAPPVGEIDAKDVLTIEDNIVFTLDDSLCDFNQDYEANADTGCTDAPNKINVLDKFSAELNGIEIKDLFTIDARTARVSVYALQGLLGEKNEKSSGGKSSLVINVAGKGKSPARQSFTFKGEPEVVLLKTPKNAPAFSNSTCEGLLEETDWQSSDCDPSKLGGSYLTPGGSVDVQGAVRGAYLKTIELLNGTGTAKAGERPNFDIFSLTYQDSSNPKKADFTLNLNGVKQVDYAVPGKNIADIFALQIDDVKDNHVLATWLNDAVVAYIEDNLTDWTEGRYFSIDPGMCRVIFVNGFGADPNGYEPSVCWLSLQSVEQGVKVDNADNTTTLTPGDGFDFNSSLKFKGNTNSQFDSVWRIEGKAKPSNNNHIEVKANIIAFSDAVASTCYYDADLSGLVGCKEQATAKVRFYMDPVLGFTVDLGKPKASVSEELVAIALDYKTDGPQTDALTFAHGVERFWRDACEFPSALEKPGQPEGPENPKVNISDWSECNSDFLGKPLNLSGLPSPGAGLPKPEAQIKEAIDESLAGLVKCLLPYTIYTPELSDAELLSCGYKNDEGEPVRPTKALAGLGDLKKTPITNDANLIVSALENQFTAAKFNVKTGSDDGFVSLGGWNKASNHGVFDNLVGSYFPATNAGAEVLKEYFDKQGDLKVAVSGAWINQMLLASFQNRQFDMHVDEQLKDLGELGQFLVDSGATYIKKTDRLITDIALNTAPYVRFVNDKIELVVNSVSVKAELTTNVNACVAPFCTITLNENNRAYLDLEVDVKALLTIDLESSTPFKVLRDETMVHIVSAKGTKLIAPGTKFDASDRGILLPPIYTFMHDTLNGVFDKEWQPSESINNICVDNDLLSAFFPTGARKLRVLANSLAFDAEGAEASHIVLAASLQDITNGILGTAGLPLLDITLNHFTPANCPE